MNTKLKRFAKDLADKPLPVSVTRFKQCQRVLKGSKRSLAGVSQLIALDPGLCMLVLRYVNRIRSRSTNPVEINSVVSAINLIGENVLSTLIAKAPVLQQKIAGDQAVRDYCALVDRSIHAAQFSKRWARIRNDGAPGELEVAALLRDVGELMLCAHDYEVFTTIRRLARERRISLSRASTSVLGFSALELSQQLARHWFLPDVVRDGMNSERWELYRPQGVMLASECARLAESGWYHDDMVACEELVATYLNISFERVYGDLHNVTLAIARKGLLHSPSVFAAQLVEQIEQNEDESPTAVSTENKGEAAESRSRQQDSDAEREKAKRAKIFALCAKQLKQQTASNKANIADLIKIMTQGMFTGLNLQRVVFAAYSEADNALVVKLARGIDLSAAGQFKFPCQGNTLFSSLLKSQKSVLVNHDNIEKLRPLIPDAFSVSLGSDSFVCASLFAGSRPLGVVYADCAGGDVQIDEQTYQGFKSLSAFTGKAIALISAKSRPVQPGKQTKPRPAENILYREPGADADGVKKRA